ncbi:MAG: hypothetical protein QM488_08370 [Rhizobiaceae bacterium]
MQDYNFWADLLDTYQSLSIWTKSLWLIVPPAFLLALLTIILRHRIAYKRADINFPGDLIYSIHRDEREQLHVYHHKSGTEKPPTLMLIDDVGRDVVDLG